MTTRKKRFRAFDPDPDCPDKYCDMPHCGQIAGYRAPKSRHSLNDYYWFCLEHVREYNKNWDFFKGMSPAQIEQQLRSSTVWDKPSWKLGQVGKADLSKEQYFKDRFGIFSDNPNFKQHRQEQEQSKTPAELLESLKALGLNWPISLTDLKKRYITLARQYHPDSNGSDTHSEEIFKIISTAYAQIRTHLMNSIEI